ncbi:hypothetical protein [Rhizobium sp. BK176]|uniref:hypothetical protein n=1 Tax=Rhizobium sp. BK176 TaxID=2587071 RepID=UPI00216929EE|nr:hypothetical protein [Rhizobium sp. BK176]MCS4089221.1 hypothetical protein [Rhizobium sp. BK176]
MRVAVPIFYDAAGIRKGNQVRSTLLFHELVDVDVHDVDGTSAPIALTWRDDPPPSILGAAAWVVEVGAEMQHVRYFEGQFWRPLETRKAIGRGDGRAITCREFFEAVESGLHRAVFPLPPERPARFDRDTEYFGSIISTNRGRSAAAVNSAASRLLVVDGYVYEKAIEPYVILAGARFATPVRDGVVKHAHCAIIRVVAFEYDGSALERCETYPIQRFDEAVAKTKMLTAGSRKEQMEALTTYNLTRNPVIELDLLNYPASAVVSECRLRLREFLSGQATAPKFLSADRTELRLLCDLHDALESLPDEASLAAVETLGKRFIESYEEARQFPDDGLSLLRAAIAAAEDRPIQLNTDIFSHLTDG